MAYDDKAPTRYEFANTDFGAGADVAFNILGPKGKAGRLYDYGVQNSTEAFTATTTGPMISVGSTSDADAYGDDFPLNALADNHAKTVRQTYLESEAGFATYMVSPEIPADTEVVLTCVGGVDSPTGQAAPFVDIIWQD